MTLVFEKSEDFDRTLDTSFNRDHEEHKKGLEEIAGKQYSDLLALRCDLHKYHCNVNMMISFLEVPVLPHTINELPVLYQWSPKAGYHGYNDIGKVKVVY